MSTDVFSSTKRITSIDLLRGLIMIIMALDHTRDFFHNTAFTEDPLNPATTTAALYFTRWITHFCAPVFVFLSGASAWLQSQRKSKKDLSLFLIKRGLWLILVEIFVVSFAFSFDITFTEYALTTIWSIAISMIILGLVIWLPFTVILAFGLLIVLGHNALDYYEKENAGQLSGFYHFLHRPNFFKWGNIKIFLAYPFLPWTGLMIIGYCFGKLLTTTPVENRKAVLLRLGMALTVFFIAIRAVDWYGDPDVIVGTDKPLDSVYAFLDTHKYPPSLLYMCMTIGPALIMMALTDRAEGRIARIISVYGRVPFFYYIIHFFMIHIVCMLFYLSRGHSFSDGINSPEMMPAFIIPGEGYDLWVVYAVWAGIVLLLYPLCRWYDRYKMNHKEKWWLSYL